MSVGEKTATTALEARAAARVAGLGRRCGPGFETRASRVAVVRAAPAAGLDCKTRP